MGRKDDKAMKKRQRNDEEIRSKKRLIKTNLVERLGEPLFANAVKNRKSIIGEML